MKNLYLIGMMGCGKSTCAQLLSQALARPALDTDQELQRRTGMTIAQLFSAHGEEYFRDLETALCRELAQKEGLIVACGGGLPLRAENRALLRQGTVVFLNRDPETIYDTGDMAQRPLAQAGRADFLARFRQREPLYRAAAHYVVGDYATPEETVADILTKVGMQS